MALGQFDVLAFLEDAWPLFASFVEEVIDAVVGDFGVERLAEFDDFVRPLLQRLFLIPNLGEDQLENFIEFVFAAVGQNQFFKILNNLFEVKILLELQSLLSG